MLKKLFTLETFLALVGLGFAIAGLVGQWNTVIAALLSVGGGLLAIWAVSVVSGEWGEPYRHLRYIWTVEILDTSGAKATIQLASRLRVRRKKLAKGGTWWSSPPHDLKTHIVYADDLLLPRDKIEIPHGEPAKRGGLYFWALYFDPPLRRGQTVWLIEEFGMVNEFTSDRICDYFDSHRTVKEFVWRVRLPANRPAKRWHGAVDYLRGGGDLKVLAEQHEATTEVVWSFKNTKRGAVYYLNIDW